MVDAFGAADRLAELATVLVGDDDGHAGEGGSRFVHGPSGNLRRALLCERRPTEPGKEKGETHADDNLAHWPTSWRVSGPARSNDERRETSGD